MDLRQITDAFKKKPKYKLNKDDLAVICDYLLAKPEQSKNGTNNDEQNGEEVRNVRKAIQRLFPEVHLKQKNGIVKEITKLLMEYQSRSDCTLQKKMSANDGPANVFENSGSSNEDNVMAKEKKPVNHDDHNSERENEDKICKDINPFLPGLEAVIQHITLGVGINRVLAENVLSFIAEYLEYSLLKRDTTGSNPPGQEQEDKNGIKIGMTESASRQKRKSKSKIKRSKEKSNREKKRKNVTENNLKNKESFIFHDLYDSCSQDEARQLADLENVLLKQDSHNLSVLLKRVQAAFIDDPNISFADLLKLPYLNPDYISTTPSVTKNIPMRNITKVLTPSNSDYQTTNNASPSPGNREALVKGGTGCVAALSFEQGPRLTGPAHNQQGLNQVEGKPLQTAFVPGRQICKVCGNCVTQCMQCPSCSGVACPHCGHVLGPDCKCQNVCGWQLVPETEYPFVSAKYVGENPPPGECMVCTLGYGLSGPLTKCRDKTTCEAEPCGYTNTSCDKNPMLISSRDPDNLIWKLGRLLKNPFSLFPHYKYPCYMTMVIPCEANCRTDGNPDVALHPPSPFRQDSSSGKVTAEPDSQNDMSGIRVDDFDDEEDADLEGEDEE